MVLQSRLLAVLLALQAGCRRHQKNTLPALREKYVDNGRIKYLFIDFPLSFHSHAEPTAIAAACAHRQGAFWKMHDHPGGRPIVTNAINCLRFKCEGYADPPILRR